MASITESERRTVVECPRCGGETSVPVPDDETDVEVRPYVAAWGRYETAVCPAGHRLWVYVC